MTRRAFYGLVAAFLIGMVHGFLEAIYQQVCDQDLS